MSRAIREDAVVTDAINAYQNGFQRTNELWAGVQWVLSRIPHVGQQINGSHILKTGEFTHPQIPVLTILYSYDDTEVHIVAVRMENPGEY